MEQEKKNYYTTLEDLEKQTKEKYIEYLKQGKLTEILDTMAKLPNITIDNDVLVMAQMPEATKIDMKEIWEKKGRNLIESPKYINSIALCIYKNDLGYTDSRGTTYLNGADKLTTKINVLYDVSQTEGNPLTYRNKTLAWSHGGQLDKFADIAEFTYNASGIRTSKVSNGFTTKYYLNGNKIVRQQDASNDMYFYYGVDGLTGFKLNGTCYYYKKNFQGDIIGIINSNNEEIVKYVYDAWGNHKAYDVKTNDLLDISSYESYINISNEIQFIAIKNPFRYRGYYYDFETGLYYLNSRYYDPELGRFINADNIRYLETNYINGFNLYCYCLNQPLKYTDETGNSILVSILIALGIGALVGAAAYTISYVANGISTNDWSWSWGDFFGSVLGGALAGPLSLLPGGMYISAFASNLFSTILSDAFNSIEDGTNFNFSSSFDTGIQNGLISVVFAGIMGNVFKIQGVNAGRGSWNSITKQIFTKLNNNIINSITIKTFGKMLGLSMYESTLDFLYNILFG